MKETNHSRFRLGMWSKEPFLAKLTGDGGGAGGMPSMRVERVFSAFGAEDVMIAREISCDMEKEGGMTGVAVLVETVAIMFEGL